MQGECGPPPPPLAAAALCMSSCKKRSACDHQARANIAQPASWGLTAAPSSGASTFHDSSAC
jgi:hypothetical protein